MKRKLMAFIMSLMMLLTAVPVNGLTAWAKAQAEAKIDMQQYFSTDEPKVDSVEDDATTVGKDTDYQGVVIAKIDVINAFRKAYEAYLTKEALAGPRVMYSEKKTAPRFTYTMKFANGAQIADDSKISFVSTSSLVGNNKPEDTGSITYDPIIVVNQDRSEVSFTFYLSWQDYKGFFATYKKEAKDAAGTHIVALTVPYSGTAKKDDKYADVLEGITGSGEAHFWYYKGFFSTEVMSITTDTMTLPLYTANPIHAVPPQEFSLPQQNLEGDLLVQKAGEEPKTESDQAVSVRPGEKLDYIASLNVKPIKDQMEGIEKSQLSNMSSEEKEAAKSQIAISNLKSTFITELTIPDELTFPSDAAAYTLSSQKDDVATAKFIRKAPVISGNKVTLTMEFEGDKIHNYAELYQAIHENTLDELQLNIKGVQVKSTAAQGSKPRVIGTVKGSMDAIAKLGDERIHFNIPWGATQKAGGVDAENPNNPDQISLTLLVDGAPIPEVPNAEILGDILVAKRGSEDFDTEHDAVFPVKAGDELNYKATLNVSGIQEQMKDVEKLKANGKKDEELTAFLNSIKLKDTESKFTVAIRYDEGLEFPTDDTKYSFAGSSAFKLNTVAVNPATRTVTLTIELVDAAKKSYAALSKAIQQDTKKILTLTVEGVKVKEDVPEETKLKTVGTVEGFMKSTAYIELEAVDVGDANGARESINVKEHKFSFDWAAKQDTTIPDKRDEPTKNDGTDFELRDNNPNGTIQLTVETLKVQEAPTQDLPTDILVQRDGDTGFDTEHKAVYPVNRGDLLNYQAIVDVSSIKKQMGEIEEQYHKLSPDVQQEISLSDTECSFHVDVTIDPGLIFPTDSAAYELKTGSGSEESFEIDGAPTVNGNKLHIDMKLKDAQGITTYAELARRIKKATADILTLNIKGVKVKEAPEAAGQLTVRATLDGSMSSTAKFGNNVIPFRFSWRGVQADGINSKHLKEDGTDWILRDKSDDEKKWIWLTVAVRDTTGILNIKKVVVGKDGEEQNNADRFPVRVWLDALPAGEAGQEPLIASQFNTLPWTDAGNYPKQNGENYYRYYTDLSIPANDIISIAGIPDGTGYYVEELTSNTNMPRGYVEDYAGLGTTGSITGNGAVTALIVNYRENAEQSIIIKKNWQKDDEKKRPASVKVKLVPHIGSADGEVIEELVHEYELTKQDGWYKVITGNKLFATMSDASKSDARKQAEALILGTKSNAASKANAQHLKGLTPSDALVDENGKLLDGDIVNDIVEGIKDFFKKIFGIEDEIVWTVEEIKVPAGYESKVSDPIETKKGLSFEITNTGTKTDTPDKPNNSGGSSSGGGSSSSGGHRHNGGSTVPAGPGLNPVPVTPEPTVLAAPDMGRSGSLPKTGERAALLGELLAVLALMAGAWALLGGKRKEQ
ncbi:LPXTG-motif cell wall-anchored protein [Fusobacterium naviforme]|nr:Cna B-type domain-containing protein [Fusobacterium naviforme]PSL10233.1 LPXTG-motif cell wall-anchored protein [Fusobacterium naviforme]STO27643.1 Uncharacterised protein [Fusobacterium naviforme]